MLHKKFLKSRSYLLVEAGSKKNQAIKEVAKKYGRNKSELYAVYHENKD